MSVAYMVVLAIAVVTFIIASVGFSRTIALTNPPHSKPHKRSK